MENEDTQLEILEGALYVTATGLIVRVLEKLDDSSVTIQVVQPVMNDHNSSVHFRCVHLKPFPILGLALKLDSENTTKHEL